MLKTQENTFVRSVFRFQFQEVLAVKQDFSLCNLIRRVANDDIAQCAFSRSVLSHQSMDFAFADGKVDSLQYLFAIDAGMQIYDF